MFSFIPYLGDVSELKNFFVQELNQRIFVFMNLADMDRIWFGNWIVDTVDFRVSLSTNLFEAKLQNSLFDWFMKLTTTSSASIRE